MAEAREPTLRVTMLPRDTNARGTIFGGVILSHIDLAGAVAASRCAARNFVTRFMREVGFIAPSGLAGMTCSRCEMEMDHVMEERADD